MKKISIFLLVVAFISLSYQEEATEQKKEETPVSSEPKVDEDGVTILTDANINAFLAENKYVFLEFYARFPFLI